LSLLVVNKPTPESNPGIRLRFCPPLLVVAVRLLSPAFRTYAIPVDTRGAYTLILHFAEFYFGSGASGNGGAGSRTFKVMCNGETLLDNFDIVKETGSLHEVTRTFRHLKPSALGKLNLTFEPIVNNATVSGIEVLDESR
jgi:Malectin domain